MFGTLSFDHLIQCCPLAFYYFSESWTDDTWLLLQGFGIWLWQRSEAAFKFLMMKQIHNYYKK